MNINGKTITITSALGLLVAIVALLNFAQIGWADIAWQTQSSHIADIAAVKAEITTDAETIAFRTEWRCSEWAEDLIDMYDEQSSGNDGQQLKDKIAALRKRMDEAGCQKYEDY